MVLFVYQSALIKILEVALQRGHKFLINCNADLCMTLT